jgi:hypothetical protein
MKQRRALFLRRWICQQAHDEHEQIQLNLCGGITTSIILPSFSSIASISRADGRRSLVGDLGRHFLAGELLEQAAGAIGLWGQFS